MRKLLLLFISMFFLMGSASSVAMAQDDDATPEGDDAASAEINPVNPAIGDTITILDQEGNPIGTVTVNSIERGWEDYDEYYEPERGTEYVAFTITIESTIERGAFDVSSYGFSLQTQAGLFFSSSFTSSEAAEPALLEDDSLANGDSLEATIVFQVIEDEPLAHLFWQPASGVFLTLANLDGE